MHPKNAWYVACTADEVADKPLGRQICNERWCSIATRTSRSLPSKTSARIAAPRSRWAMSRTANWCVVTTGW